ncbi:MAG: glycerophosphoryl diester phosphodiesterase [Verrucomicrobiales bacterium]|nr:glycerophosphoryl diester phosphodiesterase [Verrucomicrobiales bacterium]
MKPTTTHALSALFAAAALLAGTPATASAAATAINFNGAINNVTGPGSMAAVGGLVTTFNTISAFGIAPMAGGDRQVMSFSGLAPLNASGLQFTHATAAPNTTGYTILMDVYYTSIPNYVSLLQLDNANDGDLFARGSGAAGINSDYAGASLTSGSWHRIVATVDNSLAIDFLKIYVDGTQINGVDGYDSARFDLSDPSFLVFADEDGETAAGYISQFYFEDRALAGSEVQAFGAASAAAIPEPSGLMLGAAAGLALVGRRRRRSS